MIADGDKVVTDCGCRVELDLRAGVLIVAPCCEDHGADLLGVCRDEARRLGTTLDEITLPAGMGGGSPR